MLKQRFDVGWEFTEAQGAFAMMAAQWQPITLPHDASISKPRSASSPSGSGGGFAWGGVLTYRKKIHIPESWKNQSVQLEFEGVYMNAEISVNGSLVVFHPYGYTSFLVDVTPYLLYGGENEVIVVVNNSAQPNSRWYTGTGIYRHVWLRRGGPVHIAPWGVCVTTPLADPASSTVAAATEIVNTTDVSSPVILRSTILDANGERAAQVETPLEIGPDAVMRASQVLNVTNARLWSVESPNLYTLISEVLVASEVVDSEKTVFGIRSLDMSAKHGFRLNGVPMKLKGGCVHHDNGLLGAASFDRAEERKIELMKSAGFNAVRCAHNPPAPAMLDACDRLGMLVIDETFDCWRMGKNPNDYHLFFEAWWQRDTEAMVRRDRNHPSIIMWSIGNEVPERTGISDGYAWCRKQADYVRSLDHTRPITSALPALWEEFITGLHGEGMEKLFELLSLAPTGPQPDRWGMLTRDFLTSLDVAGYNYLSNRYEMDGGTFPERVICGTETWPHQAYISWEATSRLPYVIGDFVWTAIDYLGEAGIGQVSYDQPMQLSGGYPYHLANCGDFDICGFKRPQSYYRDVLWGVRKAPYIGVLDPRHYAQKITFNPWGWEPVMDSWDFPGWQGKPIRVDVYSADDEVELWINGVSAGRKAAGSASQNKAAFDVTYMPGIIEAVGYMDGQETHRTTLKTASAPAALRLTPDRETLHSEFGDLAYVTVEVVDKNGAVVRHAEHEIALEAAGVGDLIAVGTANPMSEELYGGHKRKALGGRLMAVIRTNGQPGEMRLKASADGLMGSETRITAE